MKLTWVIQLWKNVFAIKNGIIVLFFHELDFTKGHGRGLHWAESDARPVLDPAVIFPTDRAGKWKGIFLTGRAGNWKAIFPTGRAGPAIERWFFHRAEPGRQMKDNLSNGPGRQKRNEFGPGQGLKNRPVQTSNLGLWVKCPPWKFFSGIFARIYACFGENHGKLRTYRSTSATLAPPICQFLCAESLSHW